jgi:hypothetical protein
MSVETLSLIKTEQLCGYAVDATISGSEIQDPDQVANSARRTVSGSGRTSIRPSEIPSATEHQYHVLAIRDASRIYYDLQQLVRLISLFREWRKEEDNLIKSVATVSFSNPFVHGFTEAYSVSGNVRKARVRSTSRRSRTSSNQFRAPSRAFLTRSSTTTRRILKLRLRLGSSRKPIFRTSSWGTLVSCKLARTSRAESWQRRQWILQ